MTKNNNTTSILYMRIIIVKWEVNYGIYPNSRLIWYDNVKQNNSFQSAKLGFTSSQYITSPVGSKSNETERPTKLGFSSLKERKGALHLHLLLSPITSLLCFLLGKSQTVAIQESCANMKRYTGWWFNSLCLMDLLYLKHTRSSLGSKMNTPVTKSI